MAAPTELQKLTGVAARLRPVLRRELARILHDRRTPSGLPETTPRTDVPTRLEEAFDELLDACDGFLRRAAIEASLTDDERREMLRGMILTRAVDNRLKTFFVGGEVRFGSAAFQGKGFRSLGQEAIYGAVMRLRRGPRYRGADGAWNGDVIAPLIRDLGATLGMRCDRAVRARTAARYVDSIAPPPITTAVPAKVIVS